MLKKREKVGNVAENLHFFDKSQLYIYLIECEALPVFFNTLMCMLNEHVLLVL